MAGNLIKDWEDLLAILNSGVECRGLNMRMYLLYERGYKLDMVCKVSACFWR